MRMHTPRLTSLEGHRPLSLLSQVRKIGYSGDGYGLEWLLGEALARGPRHTCHDALQTLRADLCNAALASVADTSRRSVIGGCGEAAMC